MRTTQRHSEQDGSNPLAAGKLRDGFWRLPAAWGDPSCSLIRELRSVGGTGAIKLLPLVGHAAGLRARDNWIGALDAYASYVGIDPKTAARGRAGLESLDLVTTWKASFRGLPVTHWSMSAKLAASCETNDVFLFPLKILQRGTWARMSGSECLVYLAAATRAFRSTEPPSDNVWLDPTIATGVDISDIQLAYEATDSHQAIRIAIVSKSELARITGLSDRAISGALRAFRHPSAWDNAPTADIAADSPLRVYPVSCGSLLYHFRDHIYPVGCITQRGAIGGLLVGDQLSFDQTSALPTNAIG